MLSLLALLSTALAAPNGVIPIQGVLTDSAGSPLEGDVSVTFRLYTDDSGTSSLWEDTVTLSATAGRFAVDLGANAPLDLGLFAVEPTTHLGITVESDSEMPLVPLSHVPYAAMAEDATRLGGRTAAERDADFFLQADLRYLPATYIPRWAILDGVPADLADGDDDTTYGGADFATSDQACQPGDLVSGIGADGAVICVTPPDEGFTTEAELTSLLDNNYLPADYVPDWGSLSSIPAELADGDDDTQLSQATVEGYARGVAFDTTAELTSALNGIYLPVSYRPAWGDLTGVPGGFLDGIDNDTQLSQAAVEAYARGVAFDTVAELTGVLDTVYLPVSYEPSWLALNDIPADIADGDDVLSAGEVETIAQPVAEQTLGVPLVPNADFPEQTLAGWTLRTPDTTDNDPGIGGIATERGKNWFSNAAGQAPWVSSTTRVTVDASKRYTVSGQFYRRPGGSTGGLYLAVLLYDGLGNNIPGTDGFWWYYPASKDRLDESDGRTYRADFGAGTAREFPPEAVSMTVGAILNLENTGVPGDSEFLVTDLQLHQSSMPKVAWQDLNFAGTAGHYDGPLDGYAQAAFTLDDRGFVQLRGAAVLDQCLASGLQDYSGGGGSLLARLPDEAAPEARESFPVSTGEIPGGYGRIDITPAGEVLAMWADCNFVSLSTIRYAAKR